MKCALSRAHQVKNNLPSAVLGHSLCQDTSYAVPVVQQCADSHWRFWNVVSSPILFNRPYFIERLMRERKWA